MFHSLVHIRYVFPFIFAFTYFCVFILVCLMFSRVVYCFEKKNTKIRSDEYNIMLPCAPLIENCFDSWYLMTSNVDALAMI